ERRSDADRSGQVQGHLRERPHQGPGIHRQTRRPHLAPRPSRQRHVHAELVRASVGPRRSTPRRPAAGRPRQLALGAGAQRREHRHDRLPCDLRRAEGAAARFVGEQRPARPRKRSV
ncbi:MAG: hypothetical protein AVDCRST_MAG67-2016, partial [uncultured Solirubrobacteraceae bacterium]